MAQPPIDITLDRLARLEKLVKDRFDAVDKRFDANDKRFDGIESSLGKMVTVLEAHDQRLEGIVVRLDRLIEQTIRARTEDTTRMSDIERWLQALEERQPHT
jgi:predicted  nucleic acid-binding Zn-ribbon protein